MLGIKVMFFNRPEFDRYTRFNSWGSAREAFSWEDMCDIELDIPPIEVQQKVVDVYLAMVANQKAYERGLDDLKLACKAYIEDLKKHTSLVELNVFIEEVTAQNSDATYKIDDVMGVSKNKEIIPTKANASENDLTKFIVIEKNDFVYNPRSANAIAINSKLPGCIISWNNTAFRVKKDYSTVILSKYLNLWFSRAEYSRWAKYNSWGSSTELLSLDEIKKYHIPLPNIKIQEAIVKVFENYESRKFINDKLKTLIKIEIADEQKQFIAPKENINKAILLENVIAFDIFKEDVLIGFVMLRKYAEGEYFLWDYAIDYHHQNKGYGTKALMELLTFLKAKFHIHTITTTYIYGNEHAKYIYEKVGFIETDIVNEDGVHEVNMILHL